VACECIESKDGPVIWEDHFYPEIINPDTGEVVADGEEGELVFTSLTKEAMPVIRYRTRDLTRLLPPTSRSFRRMDRITGRTDDMLIVRGVNVFPSVIEEQILRDKRLAGTYQILLTREGHLDNVEVRCELQREFSGKMSPAELQAISQEMQHHIKTIAGISTRVTVLAHEAIPRTLTGKARRVIDDRPKQN
jgi:phenylacetate-CoA ligase